MPDTPTLSLILLIGIATGVFFALVLDSSFLEKRLQKEKNRQLYLESKIALARSEIRHLRRDLENAADWRPQAAYLLAEKKELEQKLTTAESQVCHLDAQVKGALQRLTETQKIRKQIVAVGEQYRVAKAEMEELERKLKKTENEMLYMRLEGKEDLTRIRGIGPAYARRLQEAGIKTMIALAQTPPEKLCEIVQLKPWQNAAPNEWIAEAKQLAAVFGDDEE